MFKRQALWGLSTLAASGLVGQGSIVHAQERATALPEVRVQAQKPRPKRGTKPKVSAQAAPSPIENAPQKSTASDAGPPPLKQRYALPATSESATGDQIREQVNIVDTEDAVKYFPSLFLRKRNYGDNQAVLATRTSGLGASARSLVYADDILLSSLIANNNTLGVPRWGLVAPEEISRIDFLYGPFSAAYPGNSEGGVLLITTRMPDKLEVTAKQTEAFQTFDRYNTKGTYRTDQTSVSIGDKQGRFSYFVSGNFQNSYSQPLAWVTNGSIPTGTTGAIPQLNRTGGAAPVVGAGGLLHTEQANIKGKFAYDVTPWAKLTYTIGFWNNDQDSTVQTYLRDAAGNPTFGGVSAFASNNYTWNQTHLANAISLKTDTKTTFDFDISASRYDYLQDIQRNPFSVLPTGMAFTPYGKIARLDGTNWMNADANGIWRPDDIAHEVSFGFHADRYYLNNPTYKTSDWMGGPDETSTLYNDGVGATRTFGLWAQDAWKFAADWKLTTGVRLEDWRAYDGFNLFTTTNPDGTIKASQALNQPGLNAERVSPKLSLAYEPSKEWLVTGSIGQASRFPTVAELYQAVTRGDGTIAIPNPNLKPEDVLSEEIAIERRFTDGKVRFSIFNENSRNTLISQLVNLNDGTGQTGTLTTNVDKTRTTGFELAAQKDNVLIDRLEVFGSVTYADARIVSDPTFIGTRGSTATGRRIPNIPAWRVTTGVTYRPDDYWSITAAMRYASKQYSTLDNSDTIANVYQAFDSYTVVDLRIQRKVTDNATVSFGIDNVGNEKYTLFHPFPQRTYVADVRVKF